MPEHDPAGGDPVAAGRAWLATLPRAVTAHTDRGADPLAAVTRLLAALDNPQDRLAVIHVVGSKGKGSTALLIESLLLGLGLRTFAFTSPHLQRWTERMRIDGADVAGARGLTALHAVRDAAEATGIRPGFFEALTVAGLWLADREGVDWCVIEAGVGARADATNVVRPAAVVITSIELEHTERLGSTLGTIAREKAGAIKSGAPVITPSLPADAEREITLAVERAGTTRHRVIARGSERDAACTQWTREPGRLVLDQRDGRLRLPFTLPGTMMAANAALAAVAVQSLGRASRQDVVRAARTWKECILPGRFETLSQLPWVIVDCAHTGASALALADTVRDLAPSRVTLVLSLSASKDLEAVCDPLAAVASEVMVTRADSDYSLDPEHIREHFVQRWPEIPVTCIEDPAQAIAHACSQPAPDHLVLATGSVYLAGRIRSAFMP